jgi:hypothetical protein
MVAMGKNVGEEGWIKENAGELHEESEKLSGRDDSTVVRASGKACRTLQQKAPSPPFP